MAPTSQNLRCCWVENIFDCSDADTDDDAHHDQTQFYEDCKTSALPVWAGRVVGKLGVQGVSSQGTLLYQMMLMMMVLLMMILLMMQGVLFQFTLFIFNDADDNDVDVEISSAFTTVVVLKETTTTNNDTNDKNIISWCISLWEKDYKFRRIWMFAIMY